MIAAIITVAGCLLIFFISKSQQYEDQCDTIQAQLEKESKAFQKKIDELTILCETKEKVYSKEIDQLKQQLSALSSENTSLKNTNKQLQQQLDNYTKIGDDSRILNEPDNSDAEDQLLNKIVDGLNEKKQREYTEQNTKNASESGLYPEQKAALDLMEKSHSNFFVTGKAGTGKSFLLKAFVKCTSKRVLKIAPTGISALNIDGTTIHATFGFDNLEKLSLDELSEQTLHLSSEKRLLLQNVDTIIIDEISMVRADTFDKIDVILRIVNHTRIVFGGKQMILFGDLFQLPPIAKKYEREMLYKQYGGIYFFNSIAYHYGNFRFFELTQNHRQKEDTRFFELLNDIREGQITNRDIEALNQRLVTDQSEIRRVLTLFPTRQAAEKVNREELGKIIGREFTYYAKVDDLYSDNHYSIKDAQFPFSQELKLKVGALIMMVANDPEKRWVNGTMGIVNRLEKDRIEVMIDGIAYTVPKFKFTIQEPVLKNGKVVYEDVFAVWQYPVVLAYAITIHKSQGMTYPRIACDISDCFAPGQAYVALSRCSSLDGLYIKKTISPESIMVDHDVQDFYLTQSSLQKQRSKDKEMTSTFEEEMYLQ